MFVGPHGLFDVVAGFEAVLARGNYFAVDFFGGHRVDLGELSVERVGALKLGLQEELFP